MRIYLFFSLIVFILFEINCADSTRTSLRDMILDDMLIGKNNQKSQDEAVKLSSYPISGIKPKKKRAKGIPRINIQNSNDNRNFEKEGEYHTPLVKTTPQTTIETSTSYRLYDFVNEEIYEEEDDDQSFEYNRQAYKSPQTPSYFPSKNINYYKNDDIRLPSPAPYHISASISRYEPQKKAMLNPSRYYESYPTPPPPPPSPLPYYDSFYSDKNIIPTKYVQRTINDLIKLSAYSNEYGNTMSLENDNIIQDSGY